MKLSTAATLLLASVALPVLSLPTLAGEAPALAAQVEAGSLPPLEERIPENPYVMQVVDGIGQYGGTWRRAILGGGDQHNILRTIGYHNLVRWNRDWTAVEPLVAESFEISEDARTFTFTLRKGHKWSDGEPFTTEDVRFWYEDVLLNKALTPAVDPLWTVGGEVMTLEVVDAQTFKFVFAAPYATFIDRIADGFGAPPTIYPRHYLEQFHETYNADGIAALVSQTPGANDWVSLFNAKIAPTWTVGYWQNTELPTLHPWMLTAPYSGTARVVAERNPYYFGVDPEGNQLPYIDSIVYDQVEDTEVLLLKALNGEIDYQLRHINVPNNKAVIAEGATRGDYRLFDVGVAAANQPTMYLNLTHKDPVKREIFQNRDFRVALSHAIDREEIVDLVYLGQGTIAQAAPREGSPFYVERLAKQYTEFDPDLAEQMLDDAGFAEKDGNGWRLGPDGNPIEFVIMVSEGDGRVETAELVAEYWQDVGINAQFRQVDRSLMTTSLIGNDYDSYVWDAPGGLSDAITDPRGFFPFNKTVIFIAPLWAEWFMNPANGEEPPAEIREQMELYRTIDSLPDAADRTQRMKEVLEKSADIFYSIGIRQPPEGFGIAKTNMKNVLDPLPMAGPLWRPAPETVQFYFEQ
ncbi:MAG: ABC transporter substrate-binding protein [Devosia sp.]